MKGTSIETIESQTEQDQLYSGFPILAVEGRKKRQVRVVFEVMANLATAHEETPSMLDKVDDDMTEIWTRQNKQVET